MKLPEKSRLEQVENLFDYFNARVENAKADSGLDISNDTALYLAQLLADRARTDRPAPPFETLAELHGHAAMAPPGQKATIYRELGDRALYLLACFRDSLDRARRPLSPSYYEDMGAAAYDQVDRVLKLWFADAFGPVFQELARQFGDCVELVGRVAQAEPTDEQGLIVRNRLILPGIAGEA